MTNTLQAEFVPHWRAISPADWAALTPDTADDPFLRYEFLALLEESGCVGAGTGWRPYHFALRDGDGRLLAAAPTYVKAHSYGEFVFDFGWAEAYQRYGVPYYLKLVTAVPFTPVVGPRLRVHPTLALAEAVSAWLTAVREVCRRERFSSWHLLFPDTAVQTALNDHVGRGLLRRRDVHFHWHNHGYATFEDYLDTMKARKRNSIRKERAKVAAQGITFTHVRGSELTEAQWQALYTFYQATYWKRGQMGYLNEAFFNLLRRDVSDATLVIFAHKGEQTVAAALFLLGTETLYGRYWGCLEEYKFLHFETSYYQGIAYCIAHGLARFDAGAQGEHKLRRGFEPLYTASYHWVVHPGFRAAIGEFLQEETTAVEAYLVDAQDALPFNQSMRAKILPPDNKKSR